MMRLILLLAVCVSACVAAARFDKHLSFKERIFRTSLVPAKQTRHLLRSCWLDTSGQCCSNHIADCQYYRQRVKKTRKTRGNYFNFFMMPFYAGNFYHQGCSVQCLCSSYQASCSSYYVQPTTTRAPDDNAVVTTTTTTTTTTTVAATTAATTTAVTTTATTTTAATTTAATTTATTTTVATTTAATTTVATTTTATTTATTTTESVTTTGFFTFSGTFTAVVRTRYCPSGVSTQPGVVRLLSGTNLNECNTFPGVVTVFNKTSQTVMCSGVVTSENKVSVPRNCAVRFTEPVELRNPVDNSVIETISGIDTSAIQRGGKYTLTLKRALKPESCPGIACVYQSRMERAIDLTNCVVVSGGYGSNTAAGSPTYSFINVTKFQDTTDCNGHLKNSNQVDAFNFTIRYNCFFANGQSTCAGDAGASVMCPLTSGEMVVIGQIENMPCTSGKAIIGLFNIDADSVRVLTRGQSTIILGTGNKKRGDSSLGGIKLGLGGESRGIKLGRGNSVKLGLDSQNRGIKLGKTNRGIKLGNTNRAVKLRLGNKNRGIKLGDSNRGIKLGNTNRGIRLGLGNANRGIKLGKTNRGIKLGNSNRAVKLGFGNKNRGTKLGDSNRGIKLGSTNKGIRLGNSNRGIKLSSGGSNRAIRLGSQNKGIELGLGGQNRGVRLGNGNQNRAIKLGSKSQNRGIQLGADTQNRAIKLGDDKQTRGVRLGESKQNNGASVPRRSGIKLGGKKQGSSKKQSKVISLGSNKERKGIRLGSGKQQNRGIRLG